MVRCNRNGALPHGTVLAYGTGTILVCRAIGTVLAYGIVSWILGLRFGFGIASYAMGWSSGSSGSSGSSARDSQKPS